MNLTKPMATSFLALHLLGLVLSGAESFEKIDPLPTPTSGVGRGFYTLEEMVKEFGRPGSETGAFVGVPKEAETTVHFSQSREHNVSVPYNEDATAVVVAHGENHREGYCAAIYLVDLSGKPDSAIPCQMKDCLRRVGEGYSAFRAPEFVKMPQFSKPLLHISYYRGGRRVGEYFDEWFRMDRGKFESVLALRTGRYCQTQMSAKGMGIDQETTFHANGAKLIAKTERSIEPREKPERKSKFETLFSWDKARGKFIAKDSRKLEVRDLSDD